MRSIFVLRLHDIKEIFDSVWNNPDKVYVVSLIGIAIVIFWLIIYMNRGKKNGK